jgi:predicted phosphoribosyltransferase
MYFKDRNDAGEKLAEELAKYKDNKDALILGIPRGGLQIGYVLSKQLNLPLDMVVVKKIPYPANPEYAIGAVGFNEVVLNEDIIESEGIKKEYVEGEIEELKRSIKERYKEYKGKTELPKIKDKIIIITDDGIATGQTMLAAVDIIRKLEPKKIVLAVPVAPPSSLDQFKDKVDEIVCLDTPISFYAIGQFYEDFEQVTDEEAIKYLNG